MSPHWTVVIPVKSLETAKSRLSLATDVRTTLVLAMLDDVGDAVRTVAQVSTVVVASADADVLAHADARGLVGFRTSGTGLNDDIEHAATALAARAPSAAVGIVVADLPCLRPEDVAGVLDAVPAQGAAYVAGLDGGTTMLLARSPGWLNPRFGPGSADLHGRDAVALPGIDERARLDVDSMQTLDAALDLGVGTHTSRWAHAHAHRPASAASASL